MGPKDVSESPMTKRNTVKQIDSKKKIIRKYGNDVRVSNLALQFGSVKSFIYTILMNEEATKDANVFMEKDYPSQQ